MTIPEHRQSIDHLDKQIVNLLNERTKHVLQIGEIKRKAGEEIYAPHRERQVFQRVCKHNEGPIPNDSLRAIYREIMSCALSIEKSMTIAYLGPEATFTHQAAIRKFGSSLRYASQKTIADVFAEVSKRRAENRGPDRPSDSALFRQPVQARADSEDLRPSANPGAMPILGSPEFSARRVDRDLIERPFRRTGGEGRSLSRNRGIARRRKV
jgi:chorismate mutase-like protein